MTSRWLSVLASLLIATPAFAQPTPADDMSSFEKDLDALFVGNGLTADQAAARAQQTSPSVRRKAAEVDAAIASRIAAV